MHQIAAAKSRPAHSLLRDCATYRPDRNRNVVKSSEQAPPALRHAVEQSMNLLALAVFATIDETAIDALKHAAATCDPHYECGGVVRKVDGGYQASGLITSNKPFGVDLEELYDSDVVADFHTHICSIHNKPFADFFSPADAMVNQGLHTVGYMLSLCDRNIRRYDPSQDERDDEEVDFHSGRVIYLTCGHIVGWVSPAPKDEDRFAAERARNIRVKSTAADDTRLADLRESAARLRLP
jgi:hypothetical protein